MRILLVAATTFEVDLFLKNKENIEVLISGLGTPVTIYALTKKILENTYDIIIQAGIAGTFSKKIKKGQVVLVKQDAFADIGVEEKGTYKTMYQLGFGDENEFPFSKGWLVNSNKILHTTHLKVVKGVTVNRLSDRKKQTLQLLKVFNADVESMEGAALHYVCLQMNIPFLQMRSISNKVGERNKNKWKIKEAVDNLTSELLKLAQTLS
ncbi:MAG: futalosine hydrolase [Ginsengibacter sp.]